MSRIENGVFWLGLALCWIFPSIAMSALPAPNQRFGTCSPDLISNDSLFDSSVSETKKLKVLVTRFAGQDIRSESLGAEVASNLAHGLAEYVREVPFTEQGGHGIAALADGIQIRYIPCIIAGGHDGARKIGRLWGADLVFWGQASCPILNPKECHLAPIIINSGSVTNKGNITTLNHSPVQIGTTNVVINPAADRKDEGAFKTSLTVVRWRRMETSQKVSVSVKLDAKTIQDLDFPMIAAAQPMDLFQFFVGAYGFINKKYLFAAKQFKSVISNINIPDSDRTQIYSLIGVSYLYTGNLSEGFSALQLATQSCPQDMAINSLRCRAGAITNLGWAFARTAKYAQALSLYQNALQLHRKTNDIDGQITTLNNIGFAYQGLNQIDLALSSYESALSLIPEDRNLERSAALKNNIASVLIKQNRNKDAIELLDEASRYYAHAALLGGVLSESSSLRACSVTIKRSPKFTRTLAIKPGDLDPAKIQTFDVDGILAVRMNLAEAYYNLGRIVDAYAEFEQARIIATEIGDKIAECVNLERMKRIFDASVQDHDLIFSLNTMANAGEHKKRLRSICNRKRLP